MNRLIHFLICCSLALCSVSAYAQSPTKVKSSKKTHQFGMWYGDIQLIDSLPLSTLSTDAELKAEGRPYTAVDTLQTFELLSMKMTLLTPKGPVSMDVNDNFTQLFRNMLSKAYSGCYLMLTDIRTRTPQGYVIYLENYIFKLL